MLSNLLAVETATPPNRVTQSELFERIRRMPFPKRTIDLYERFLLDDGIEARYFGWNDFDRLLSENVDEKMARFQEVAADLAVESLRKALTRAGIAGQELDAIFIATCTGYLCPGLTSYVIERMDLYPDIHALDIVGVGCAGGLAALRTAEDYLTAHPDSRVAVIAVEVCSAALDWEQTPELILSNAIFSDGAAALILSSGDEWGGMVLEKCVSMLLPAYRDQLRFRYRKNQLSNVISPRVPLIASEAVYHLNRQLTIPGESVHYAFHSGGRRVLDAIQNRLGLSDGQMSYSRSVLKRYGNISSPSVFFVLKAVLDQAIGEGRVVAFSFGAGFSAFGISMSRNEISRIRTINAGRLYENQGAD